ncbi:MAG: response regulator [Chloroflexi bacterium]|nr:response regulator [Chloroflexota bacterium]
MDVRILIIEDSSIIVKALVNILSRQGYGVESCNDGNSGWKRLVEGAENTVPMPDLLLLDLNMPGIDGMTLLRRLRGDERFARLPVMILTAETDTDTRLMALREGANDYLLKPVQTVELLARVKTLIGWKMAERLQQQRMERLVEAGRILLSTLDLDSVLQRVMEIAMVEMDVEDTSIWLQESDGDLQCRAAFGSASDRLVGTRIKRGQGVAGWALEHKQSSLVPDVQKDKRFYSKVDEQIEFRTRDLATVPLLVRETGIGVLQAVNKKQGLFSTADLAWLEVLAPIAAAAIANARLFQELRDRTVELQQRTVQLQAHNEELDAFAHTVAHDLKSPVTSIVGYSTMLEETYAELPEDSLRTCLRAIAAGGNRMSRIVDGLLLLSGVRKKEVETKPLDTAKIVAEAVQRLENLIHENQAQVILPDIWPVAMGYAPWIEEVWVNYLSNAIKYGGRPPHVELGATVESKDAAPSIVCFWIRDNGPGLSPEAQSRLFVPFTQLDQVKMEGYGLGLSIVRRIVEKLDGEVGVKSQVDQGSMFTFTLPYPTS